MNPVQIVESARPNVGSMSADERRRLREELFDAAMRSQPAPTGPEVNPTHSRRANAIRLGALMLFGAVGVGGLAFSVSRSPETGENLRTGAVDTTSIGTDAKRTTVIQAPPPTTAPSTTLAPEPGTAEAPLLFPPERSRLDDLNVSRLELGGSSLLLRAPDLTTISLREADGIAPAAPVPPTTVLDDNGEPQQTVPPPPVRVFGGFDVQQSAEPGAYDVAIPCGTLQVRERAGNLPFRPAINELFDSMSLDAGVINLALPAGWDVIDLSPSADEFVLGIPIDLGDKTVTITLAQYPGGGLANAGFGDKQFEPITFRGQQSWLSHRPDDPADFELIGMIGTTAFSVHARDVTLIQLETALASFTPGNVDEWVQRFGPLELSSDPDVRTCLSQPEFNLASP